MSDYRNNEGVSTKNGTVMNEYGERISPKPEKKDNSADNNDNSDSRTADNSYGRRSYSKRPVLPPRGMSADAFGRRRTSASERNSAENEGTGSISKGFFGRPGVKDQDKNVQDMRSNSRNEAQRRDQSMKTAQGEDRQDRRQSQRQSYTAQQAQMSQQNRRDTGRNDKRRQYGDLPASSREDPQTGFSRSEHPVYRTNHRAVKRTPLRIIPLGGLNEIGKNMTVFECGNDMFIVDCGLAFPDSDMPGVDLVIPDFSYVEQNASKIRGIVITHGHEDHIGGLAYLLKKISIPVYATRLTIGLIEGKLREHNLLGQTKLNVIAPRQTVKMGCMAVEFIKVNHSIPDAVALAIHTPAGIVIHTGDFKVDYTPIDGGIIDLARFGELGSRGVLALMSDSTNAERPGHTDSERKVGESFEKLFAKAEGKRIIIATFASNIHRVQQIINNAVQNDRKVAVFGRSMLNVINAARELGYLSVPEGVIIEIEEMNSYPPEKIVLITTGSQGEPMSALTRMAMNEHRSVTITPMDYIIISANPIPGNEKFVTRVVNELLKAGAEVVYEAMYDVHVSGHACQEELKLMMALTRPRFFIPVHGEYKHLKKAADLACSMGIAESNIMIGAIGDVIELDGVSMNITGSVPSGRVLVDGLGVGDVGSIVLRDRKHLAEDGLIVVVATIESESGTILAGPDILSRGFVYVRESEEMMEAARGILRRSLEGCLAGGVRDWNSIKSSMRDALSDYIYMQTKRNPMILPIIEEI